MLVSYPLMAAIQEICARIGRVTGCGLAANLRKNYPRPLLYFVLVAMSAANIFNLGADIGAMGDPRDCLSHRRVVHSVFNLRKVSEMAHPLAILLHRRRLLCACSVVRRASRDLDSTCCTDQGISDGLDCCTGHHNQPLSVFLASFSGG